MVIVWSDVVEASTMVRVWHLVMKEWSRKVELIPPQDPTVEMKWKVLREGRGGKS